MKEFCERRVSVFPLSCKGKCPAGSLIVSLEIYSPIACGLYCKLRNFEAGGGPLNKNVRPATHQCATVTPQTSNLCRQSNLCALGRICTVWGGVYFRIPINNASAIHSYMPTSDTFQLARCGTSHQTLIPEEGTLGKYSSAVRF